MVEIVNCLKCSCIKKVNRKKINQTESCLGINGSLFCIKQVPWQFFDKEKIVLIINVNFFHAYNN